jgi:EAL domain-containing protein (putative c-di-GMP-specific phosphodiesterase class I)/ActR/RegA family two-component response regulator
MKPMATGTSVYILDDDPDVRAIISHTLSGVGYRVESFPAPELMFEALNSAPPAVVVLDLALGESDAVEVIRRLAAARYCGQVLLISVHDQTTLADIQRIGQRHGLGMLPPLRKPFRSIDLVARLMSPHRVDVAASPHDDGRHLSIDLIEALESGWLELWYQPKLELRSFAICGAEALLRARHPEHGIIGPGHLLPSPGDPAHHRLARFVLCRAIANWQQFADLGHVLKLSVNMPAGIIKAPEFVALVRQQLPPHPQFPGLIVEMTEEDSVGDMQQLAEVGMQLKLLGVALSLDDFGTGYASVERLLELRFSEIKLDRSYVSQCSTDPVRRAVCRSMINLAHRVGSLACAEGVETPEDLQSLIRMGCDIAQGFLFSRPMPTNGFIAHLNEWRPAPTIAYFEHPRPTVASGSSQ